MSRREETSSQTNWAALIAAIGTLLLGIAAILTVLLTQVGENENPDRSPTPVVTEAPDPAPPPPIGGSGPKGSTCVTSVVQRSC